MLIPSTAGRPVPVERREGGSLMPAVSMLLTALALVAVGIAIGLIVGNRLLVTQREAYGESNMSTTSVVLDLMDDFLPYLAWTITAALALMLLAVTSWLFTRTQSPTVRYALVGLLGLLLLLVAIWLGLGRRTDSAPLPMITPTPVASLPDT